MKPFCTWFMCVVGLCVSLGTPSLTFAQELPVPALLDEGHLYLQAETVNTAREANLLEDPETLSQTDRVRVLVLDRPLDLRLKTELQRLGVELLDYLPRHSFTVRLKGVDGTGLSAVEGVVRVIDYRDAWKLQPGIIERLGTHQQPSRRELDEMGLLGLIVSLHPGEDLEIAITSIRETGATVERVERVGTHDELSVITLPQDLELLSRIESVLFVEDAPDITLRNATTRWVIQTNVTNQTPVYDNGIHGEGQVIGVLDGRVDQGHCSFPAGKILAYNSSNGSDTHGTHVAGTAAGNNGVNNDTRGIAYEANLVTNTTPNFTEAGITNRLNLHHSQGGRIHTNSWGNDGTTAYDSLARGFDVFLHNNEESFVCLAVTNGNVLRNPENAKNLLAVGASQDSPNEENHCTAGIGPTSDGRRKPEVYTPGCSTQSSQAGTACGTTGLTGTSMACPAVAGATALIRQYYVDGYYPSGAPNPADAIVPSGALLKATIVNSAVDMTGITGYPSNLEGWGSARISDPLFFTGDNRALGVLEDVRNASGFSTGQNTSYNVNVIDSTQDLRITLAFTDVAATAGSAAAAVNNLDLEVVAPNGTTYFGNFFSGGFSASGGSRDSINNVEQVHINNPQQGSWTVRVVATAVNSGTQGYGVIATGGIQLAPADCNGNGVPDDADISGGTSSDCDGNLIPDECQEDCNGNNIADACDIIIGTSVDCDGNSVPDECQPDCNGNGIADACDISSGLATDCEGNGVPDSCDIAAGAIDCDGNGAIDSCEIASGGGDCNLNGSLDSCDIAGGVSSDCNGNGVPDDCDAVSTQTYSASPSAPVPPDVNDTIVVADTGLILDVNAQINISHTFIGDLIVDLTSPGGTVVRLHNETGNGANDLITTYDDDGTGTAPAQPLSGFDGQSKQGTWSLFVTDVFPTADDGVVNSWGVVVEAQGSGFVDCNSNGVDDTCDLSSGTASDCNANDIPDSCDIAAGTSTDSNGNGVPDECDTADCNGNGVADDQDIAGGTSQDCNVNGIPDECDITSGLSDCNGNGVPDSCELASGSGADCNGNGTLDSCDLNSGSASDCNGNSVPDSCDLASGAEDCNTNGIPDSCDIASGAEQDADTNGVPDVCEQVSFVRGDGNEDGSLDISDVVFMLVMLFNNGAPPSCGDTVDCNDDGNQDISDPVQLLSYLFDSGVTLPVPSPGCGLDPTVDGLTCDAYAPCP